jgi:hypothetical protein
MSKWGDSVYAHHGLRVSGAPYTALYDFSGNRLVEAEGEFGHWGTVRSIGEDGVERGAIDVLKPWAKHRYLFSKPGAAPAQFVDVRGWDLSRKDGAQANAHGVSVNKGGKFGWLGFDGKLVIPPVYQHPINYLGAGKYEVEVGGENKIIEPGG